MNTNDSIILGEQTQYGRVRGQQVRLRGTSTVTQVPRLASWGRPVISLLLLIHGCQGLPYGINWV